MKKTNSFRTLLGITQNDIAQLLQVTRSQWAMFELGKRDLPLAAKVLLAEVLGYLKNTETEAKELPQLVPLQANKKTRLEELLRENEYQRLAIARKLKAMQKKYKNNVTILRLTGLLATRPEQKAAPSQGLLQLIADKASKALSENSLAVLVEYELKHELLELEKLLLDSSLRKFA